MDINKAIRKQKKSYKRFMLTMSFIFLLLPTILLICNKMDNVVYDIFLTIIEILIFITVIISSDMEVLTYETDDAKIKLKTGVLLKKINIPYSKVAAVHTILKGADMQIIIISNGRLRNNTIKKVGDSFIRSYPELSFIYVRLKKINPDTEYYYLVISRGGYFKYKLLDHIYKSCVHAVFSEQAIEIVREYRNQI